METCPYTKEKLQALDHRKPVEAEAPMNLYWKKVIEMMGNIPEPIRSDTCLTIYSPILPWNFLLEVPELYRYFQNGMAVTDAAKVKQTDFPLWVAMECGALRQSFRTATKGFASIHYLFSMDMALNLVRIIQQLYRANAITNIRRESLFNQIERGLSIIEKQTENTENFNPAVHYSYCDSFLPPFTYAGSKGFFGIDPAQGFILLFHGKRSWSYKIYHSLTKEAKSIGHSNNENRKVFFQRQYDVLNRQKLI